MFMHDDRDLRSVVHGDDFTMAGNSENLDWFRGEISARMDVKFRARLGGDSGDDKSVRLLHRIVEWTKEGIMYEADQRRAEIITIRGDHRRQQGSGDAWGKGGRGR